MTDDDYLGPGRNFHNSTPSPRTGKKREQKLISILYFTGLFVVRAPNATHIITRPSTFHSTTPLHSKLSNIEGQTSNMALHKRLKDISI